jgi:uncharacterized protein (DUF58 family)
MNNKKITPRDILKKVRLIDIRTRRAVNDLFAGQYHSVFKGRGVEFAEVREYQIGDDVRTIDWNVTARQAKPYVKLFEEERELTVFILADMSPSSEFGTTGGMKNELTAEIASLLAFSAAKNNDKVGLMIFTDSVERFVQPKKGREHILRIIREILYFEPKGKRTDIGKAVSYLNRMLKRSAIIFLISDFLDRGYEKPIRVAAKKHDIVPIILRDPRELELASIGLVELQDAETGESILVDTSDFELLNTYRDRSRLVLSQTAQYFKSIGLDYIEVITGRSYIEPLIAFFRRRAGRF